MKTKSFLQTDPNELIDSAGGKLAKRLKTWSRDLQAFALAALALGVVTSTARAGQSHFGAAWPTNAPGIWEQDGIWTTSAYPNNGHVIINQQGQPVPGPDPTYDVLIDVLPQCTLGIGVNVQAVNIFKPAVLNLAPGGALIAHAGFGNGGQINLAAGSQIHAYTGTNGIALGNAGVITLNGINGAVDRRAALIVGNGSFVNNGGQILMSDSSNNQIIALNDGDSFLIAPAGQVRGAGQLNPGSFGGTAHLMNIFNQGLIEATQPSLLTIGLGATFNSHLRNTGTLRASGPATLRIHAFNVTGTVNNDGGIIEAVDNGTVRLVVNTTVIGGTLITSGNGTIRGDYSQAVGGGGYGGTFKDVLNKAKIVLGPGENIGLAGVFTNEGGQVRIDGNASDETGLLMRSPEVTLAGNGVITMSATGGIAGGDTPGQTMIVNNGFTIRGNGSIGTLSSAFLYQPLRLVNHGLIEATTGMTIYVRGSDNTNVANDGTLRAANGASYLQFNGPGAVVNNNGGTIEALGNSNLLFTGGATLTNNAGGTIDFNGGTLQVDVGMDLNGGTLQGNGTIQGEVRNNGGVFSPGHSPGKITINGNYTQGVNGVLNMEIGGTAAGTEYDQLKVNGTATLGGTLNVSLINGFRPKVGDVFQLIAPNSLSGAFATINTVGFTAQANSSSGGGITLTVLTVPDIPLNIATRLRVNPDPNQLIGGFIITGTEPKKVIIRAIGPSLSSFFSGVLADPTLELFQGTTLLASNDDWKVRSDGSSQQAEVEATTIPPTNDLESALVRTLAPGAYTAIVRGKGGTSGIGLVEAYDLDQAAKSKLANIATRGFVDTDNNVMIGGFIIGGNGQASARVVIRAIGPSLSGFGITGALQDPTLELKNANGSTLVSNDDWKQSQEAEITQTGLAPTDIRESALVTSLPDGNYTAIVRGTNNSTGVAVVEVYSVQ